MMALLFKYGSNSTLAQYWTVSYDAKSGYYVVRSAASGKVLDCKWGGTASGTKIQQYSANGSAAQWWRFVKNADGSYSILSAKSGLALDIPGAQAHNGSILQLYASNGSNVQKWALAKAGPFVADGYYQIVSRLDSDCVIDVNSGSKAEDAKIQIWNSNKTLAQKWQVQLDDQGRVTFKNANSGRFLSDAGGKLSSLKQTDDSCLWVPAVSINGGLVFVNLATPQVLDLSGGNVNKGTVVGTYSANNTPAQA